ncbi:MAG: DUF6273 domain-containing protein [Succinimonas sp.]|nr:DUF6273 domain-containing protein [Succinimonas sp.]
MTETKVNSSFLNKLKSTRVNSFQKLPEITGQTLDGFHVNSRLDIMSGEADIYLCSKTDAADSKRYILKYYRRENAVKQDILNKLREVRSPFVATLESYGVYEGHQYVIRPYYEMPALSDVLASGERFSGEELKTLIIPSVIEGLKSVHEAGILHKDLKPGNLIPDDTGEHIVLIDFGISSDAGNNTFVVTQTGMTPFYAAPEALQGIFHRETDYYALGITVYELYTGQTPFQNAGLSAEEAARLASINKIEFPEDFPEDLKRLVQGLTYKDLSHRNEPDNPNRRWGYPEVKRWLAGEDVPVPGESAEVASGEFPHKFLPYRFEDEVLNTPEELARAMLKKPMQGIRDLGRGLLTHHFGYLDSKKSEICQKAENLLGSGKSANLRIFHDAMYALTPGVKGIFLAGREFGSFQELSEHIFDLAVRGSGNDGAAKKEADEAFLLISSGVWINYTGGADPQSPEKIADRRILEAIKEIATHGGADPNDALLAMGYSFSEKCRKAVCLGRTFDSLAAFGKELAEIASSGNEEDPFLQEALRVFRGGSLSIFVSLALGNPPEITAVLRDLKENMDEEYLAKAPRCLQGFYLGYRLSGYLKFRLGDYVFEGMPDFDTKMTALENEDRAQYLRLIKTWSHVLVIMQRIVPAETQKGILEKRITDLSTAVFGDYEYQFKNSAEFMSFLRELEDGKRYAELKSLRSRYGWPLRQLDKDLWKSDASEELTAAVSRIPFLDSILSFPGEFIKSFSHKPEACSITAGGITYHVPVPGSFITFGRWQQGSHEGSSPIEWLVLDQSETELLAVSRFALDVIPYHDEMADITWTDCDLRRWLNSDFLNGAFTPEERESIAVSWLPNASNPESNASGGHKTRDRIFCLSLQEAGKYFRSDADRVCSPTPHTLSRGAFAGENRQHCLWWLRSPGFHSNNAALVHRSGTLLVYGFPVNDREIAVRPALRLKLSRG